MYDLKRLYFKVPVRSPVIRNEINTERGLDKGKTFPCSGYRYTGYLRIKGRYYVGVVKLKHRQCKYH